RRLTSSHLPGLSKPRGDGPPHIQWLETPSPPAGHHRPLARRLPTIQVHQGAGRRKEETMAWGSDPEKNRILYVSPAQADRAHTAESRIRGGGGRERRGSDPAAQ